MSNTVAIQFFQGGDTGLDWTGLDVGLHVTVTVETVLDVYAVPTRMSGGAL